MKYLNKFKHSFRFSLFIFLGVFSILIVIVVCLLLMFPIQIKTQKDQTHSKILNNIAIFWPESPLKLEKLSLKKLKRYSRQEIERREKTTLKNMRNINVPIYDLWLDQKVTNNIAFKAQAPQSSTFIWPTIPVLENTPSSKENTLANNSAFVYFPNKSHVKVKKGVYLGSGNSIKSKFPLSKQKRYLILEVLPLSPGNITISLGQYVWTKTFSIKDVHKTAKFFVPVYDSLGQTYKMKNVSSSLYLFEFKIITINENAQDTIYVSKQNLFWDINHELDDISHEHPYPLYNDRVLSDRKTTLAKGYNTVFIELNNLDSKVLSAKNFDKIMPTLSDINNNSIILKDSFDASMNEEMQSYFPHFYQSFGYKTAIFIDDPNKSLNYTLTSFKEFNTIKQSWLTETDAKFKQRNPQEESKTQRSEGLSAVFGSKQTKSIGGLDQQSFELLSNYIFHIASDTTKKNIYSHNDTVFIHPERYSTDILIRFSDWVKQQKQNRFYMNLQLTSEKHPKNSTLQDAIKMFWRTKSFNFKNLRLFSEMHLKDRQLKFILENLQTEHVSHRTIIFLILKNNSNPKKSTAIIYAPGLKKSEQQPSYRTNSKDLYYYSMDMVGIPVKNIADIGQSYTQLESGTKTKLEKSPSEKKLVTKYNLLIYPSLKNCQSFIWKSPRETIHNISAEFPIYQLHSTQELEIFPCDFGEQPLKIAWLQKKVNLPETASNKKTILNPHVHGYFAALKNEKIPVMFYYGRDLLLSQNFPLNFDHSKKQINSLFIVDKKEIDQIESLAVRSFKFMQLDDNLSDSTRASLLISKMYAN